ncbi:helix-turn-helix domain-containing protein [Paenibacillus sp. SYP-B3998]|uniref:Helix-turn-helix domain-containing protein n=1 Tax=Paenibacillus sp. SYP-B3998 TaxID=2678564 RepID=A0A6G4A0P8_9BACL|nr:helix-turn-helix domain-containing protein [Paenibacillus sp. SYP-B3998]
MTNPNLYELVLKAKHGDKDSMNRILELFHPIIQQVCNRTNKNDRHDLRQHLAEKIIQSVIAYDMDTVPDYSTFCKLILH